MKVSIVGVGHVGAAIAFAIVTKGLCQDLVLVNRTRRKAEGEAADLQHAAAFGSRAMRISAGEISETAGSDVVVLAMSAPRDRTAVAGAARKAQVHENCVLVRQLMPDLVQASPNAVFLVVTNPVDAMTYVAWKSSGLPSGRIIGSGTLIDSARFRAYLSEHMHVHPDDIRAYVLGEHGDTQFPALSVAATGGERLDRDPVIHRLFERTVASAHEVFAIKGYTNYAIGLASAMIIESILLDSHRTLPVSTLIQGFQGVEDVCLSIPVVIGRAGVVRALVPYFSASEIASFKACAASVKEVIDQC
ncbi:MAG: NAD(P)-binding domain-containing protein [Pirellulaceae bacterium]|nr:NAD(P)-binding domain-containing protein [Pirellulaceae bacterium]